MRPAPTLDKSQAASRTGNAKRTETSFAGETPQQQFDHRIIAFRYGLALKRRGKRHNPKTYVRIRELERVFADRYGKTLPNDDAGLDDIFIMANHLAHLDAPEQRIRLWVRRWAPWHGDERTAALTQVVTAKPQKWRADALAQRLGLELATRTRLGITTIGATDCGKAKRAALRRKRNNAAKRARRAMAGAASHSASAARTKPWTALGISRSTYYRGRANGTVGTNSGTACPKDIMVDAKQCHDALRLIPRQRAAGAALIELEFAVPNLRCPEHFTISIPVKFRATMLAVGARLVAAHRTSPEWHRHE